MKPTTLLALLALLAIMTTAVPALAQDGEMRVLLLPALGTEELRAGPGELAMSAVERALRAARFSPERPAGEVLDIVRDCPDTTVCLNQLLAAAGLHEAVLTAVWARAGESVPHEVLVTFADAEGHQHSGRAEVAKATTSPTPPVVLSRVRSPRASARTKCCCDSAAPPSAPRSRSTDAASAPCPPTSASSVAPTASR